MTFEEFKANCEELFKRKLTDKEIAEIAINSVEELKEELQASEGQIGNLEETIETLKEELSEAFLAEDKGLRNAVNCIQKILADEPEDARFEICVYHGEYTLSYAVKDMLVFDEKVSE